MALAGPPLMEDNIQPWKSVRPGKINWTEEQVVRLAEQWHALLPAAPMELIMNNRLPPGCRLVNLHSEISTPGSEEISHNYNWLQPVCAENPEKVPSGFYLADAFLALDAKMRKHLLIPLDGQSKAEKAMEEGKRVKKLVGSLRHLFRNSPLSSPDENVDALKKLLRRSPDRRRHRDYHFVAEFENPDPSEGEEAHEDEVGGDLALGDEEGDSREDPSSSSTAESEDGGNSGGSEAGCESDSSESDSGESDSGESGDGDVVSVPLASPPLATFEEFPTPKEENPVDPKLKKFWAKFVVPKFSGGKKSETCAQSDSAHESSDESGDEVCPNKEWVNDMDDPMNYDAITDLPKTLSPGWSPESPVSSNPHAASSAGPAPVSEFDDGECEVGLEDPPSSSDSESDPSDLSSCGDPVVDENMFTAEMEKGNREMHDEACRASTSGRDSVALATPSVSRPEFWGFPMVETPPKTDDPAKKVRKLKKRNQKSKAKKGSGKKAKKASFRKGGSKKGVLKSRKGKKPTSGNGATYNGYDLTAVPREAWPCLDKPNRGQKSYTLNFGGGVVEVLVAKQAYFIKKVAAGFPGPSGQVSWSKYDGPIRAWQIVKERSGIKRWG